MDIYEILGIEPTKDKKKITDAYRQKLLETNPEDKPEEFKELRSANVFIRKERKQLCLAQQF